MDAPFDQCSVVFCDSGLGGLDIAADFIAAIKNGCLYRRVNVLCFNAWLKPGFSFNQLPDFQARSAAMQQVLKGISTLAPDAVFFACNTLSVIKTLSAPEKYSFPIYDTITPTVKLLQKKLEETPDSEVILLGTLSTVEGNVYAEKLRCAGIAPDRIHACPCPGLATQIEYAPDGADVRLMLSRYAGYCRKAVSSPRGKVFIALCCTHFGYSSLWQEIFGNVFSDMEIVNPNRILLKRELPDWCDNSCPAPQINAGVLTRVAISEAKRLAIGAAIHSRSAELYQALQHYKRDNQLFDF